MIEKDRVRGAGDGQLHVGVGVHHVRRLAAQLQRHLLQIAGRGLHDQSADLAGTGEGDLVDVRVGRQRRAGFLAEAGHDVDDAIRQARFEQQLAQSQRGQRGLLGRFEHHRAAGGQDRARASRPPSAAGNSTE